MEKPAQWALVAAAWFLALTVALLGFIAWRHFQGAGLMPAVASMGAADALAVGATAVCPVTHEKVVVGPATPHVVYMDRVYYFSMTKDLAGNEPRRLFLMDPESYLHPGQTPPQPVPAGTAGQALQPALAPTNAPTVAPTLAPTVAPTMVPSSAPKPASPSAKP